jgi:hypothetical protein
VTPPRWLYWPGSAAAWEPTDLTGLQCWLDASDSSTITESGGSISLWEDKAGSNDADDAVNTSNVKITTKRPTVATAAQNGLDAVNFNGSQWFDHNTARGMLKDRSCALMAVAMKYGSLNNFQFAWTNRSTAGSTPIVRFQLIHESTNLFSVYSLRLDGDTSTETVNTSANPPYNTNWHIHLAVLDWAADTLSYYIDGSLIGTDSYASGGANTSNTDLPTTHNTWTAIGNTLRSGSLPLSSGSRIGEMICGAKSSGSYATSDREKLEGYLAHKWGLESNLPSTHPYKSSAP